jgi:phage nucleotide-binding protein
MQLKDLKPVGNKIDRGISIVVYANPGVGKTTLGTTLPPEETLIINAEAGLGPLLGKGHSVFNILEAVTEFEFEKVIDDIYKKLRTESHPFKNIVIDNLSEIENQLILNITQRHGKEAPTLREYGDAAFKMKQWIHNFRDLQFLGMNVVFNAWEFPMDLRNVEGSIITLICPKVSKSNVPVLCGCVDVVGHLEVHEKTGKRWIRLRPNEQYLCKSQFKGIGGANDPSGELPDLSELIHKINDYNYEEEEK